MTDHSRRQATVRDLGDGRVGIWVAYEDREEAKALPGARWNPSLKCWHVAAIFTADAEALVKRLNRRFEHTSSTDVESLTTVLVALFAALPDHLRRNVHRALARALHPDQGGDAAAMRSLNEAWAGR